MPRPHRLSHVTRTRGAGLILAAVATLGGCEKEEATEPGTGTLRVEWTGADTGQMAGPAVAEWCDSLRFLQVSTIHGDTGFAFVIYPKDSVIPARYGVMLPAKADTSRPAAAIALRWFAEVSIRGFRGDGGEVVLAALVPGAGSGRFSAKLKSATDGSRLAIKGTFERLTISRSPASCGGRPPDDTLGTGDEDDPDDETGAE